MQSLDIGNRGTTEGMILGVRPDVPMQEEMTVESVGQQPVVVLKQGNAYGAKGITYYEHT